MKKYQVIGGQYEHIWYGESDSLHGAKIIASCHREYWDNWQGWQTPDIYTADQVEDIESNGRILTHDGEIIRVPKPETAPSYFKVRNKWLDSII